MKGRENGHLLVMLRRCSVFGQCKRQQKGWEEISVQNARTMLLKCIVIKRFSLSSTLSSLPAVYISIVQDGSARLRWKCKQCELVVMLLLLLLLLFMLLLCVFTSSICIFFCTVYCGTGTAAGIIFAHRSLHKLYCIVLIWFYASLSGIYVRRCMEHVRLCVILASGDHSCAFAPSVCRVFWPQIWPVYTHKCLSNEHTICHAVSNAKNTPIHHTHQLGPWASPPISARIYWMLLFRQICWLLLALRIYTG